MRGIESAVTFVLFFAIMVSLFYITTNAMFNYLAMTDAAHKQVILRSIENRTISYRGVCDGNYLDVYYGGGVPDYSVRIVCVDYNAYLGTNMVCIVPMKGGSRAVDQMFPVVNPLQRPYLEYNMLACTPATQWVYDCNVGKILCFGMGKKAAYPFVPKAP